MNSRKYEAMIWRHYKTITAIHDNYYNEKAIVDPEITDAYIIFRAMEGQHRAYNAYDLSYFQRYFLANICCLEKFFRKKMLLQKGNLFVY